MRAWRHTNTAYIPRNIQPTVPYGGGSVMVWGCISHDWKLNLVTIQNWWSVYHRCLATSCCPPLQQPPIIYKACVYEWQRQVSSFKSSNRLPPRRSCDFCSLASHEHIWDMLGRRIQAREPPVQNIRQLEAALHREWQQLSQHDIRRLTGGMRCRVEAVIQARGGYTRYWTLKNRFVKWFISDVLKVKWQSYRAFWTVNGHVLLQKLALRYCD
jgi:hypothetical protein